MFKIFCVHELNPFLCAGLDFFIKNNNECCIIILHLQLEKIPNV